MRKLPALGKRSKKKTAAAVFCVFVLALFIFRLYLPVLVKNYLNEVLRKIPGYEGHVEGVGIHLWRGAYSIRGLELDKTGGKVPVPFLRIKKIDFSIASKPLFRGNLSGKTELDHPILNFVASASEDKKQTSIDKSWRQRAKEIFPLRIARFGVKEGEIHFRNFDARPPVNIFIRQINLVAANLTNSRRLSKTLKATVDGSAVAMQDGLLRLHMEINPFSLRPSFALALKLEHLQLSELNDFFKYYLAVIAKTGTLDFYMEGKAKEGAFGGYVKPLLEKFDLIQIKEKASVGETFKALGVKFISYALKNHAKDRLGTRIKIRGTVDKPDPDVWSAIASFLHNWLI